MKGLAFVSQHRQARFAAAVKKNVGWRCSTLSSAKHRLLGSVLPLSYYPKDFLERFVLCFVVRFESFRTPLSRASLHFEALVETADTLSHLFFGRGSECGILRVTL